MVERQAMELDLLSSSLSETETPLGVVTLVEGDDLPALVADAHGAADVKAERKKQALVFPAADGGPERVLTLGLGKSEKLDEETFRVAGSTAAKRAAALSVDSLAWELPSNTGEVAPELAAAAFVEGAILAAYKFDRFKSADPDSPKPPVLGRIVVTSAGGTGPVADATRVAVVAAEATNRARDLQNLPANIVNPAYLAGRAEEIAAAHDKVTVKILGPDEITDRKLGGILAVSKGSANEPRLITLEYNGGGDGPKIGFVGKAVTFDTGGISLKPSAKMEEMKFDMSGGAAVLEAVAAIAELDLPVNIVAVVPSVENMPGGSATRPGDIITQYNGKTVEVNNTDAEGRLILADALTWAVRDMGAEKLVDLATLTGAVVIALGSTYAALISNDDDWAAKVDAAVTAGGELAWRLPLHPDFKELTKGRVADLTNAAAKRKAGTIYAGSFLEEFTDDVPWAHIDIAGTAWDTDREYFGSGATGFGVRSLIALARSL